MHTHHRLYARVSDIQTHTVHIIPHWGTRSELRECWECFILSVLKRLEFGIMSRNFRCARMDDLETNQKIMLMLQSGWQRYAIINSTPFMPSGEFVSFPRLLLHKRKEKKLTRPGLLKANCHKTLIFWLKRGRSFEVFWLSISCRLHTYIYIYSC